MNLDGANTRIKNDLETFDKLKNAFTKIHNSENLTREKRIAIFKTMYSIEERDNEGLKQIYTSINEKMQNFEDNRKNHLDYLQKLIRITEFYPIDFKEQKRKLEDLAKNRKLLGPPPVSSGQQRPQYEQKAEKDFANFIKNETEDKKNLILHFIYSELKYHSETLENLSKLFFEINNIAPLEYLEKFGKDYVGKYNYSKLGINLKEIKNQKKDKKDKKKRVKDEIYDEEDEEEEENDDDKSKSKSNTSFKESKKKSEVKNSSIKKSTKKSKIKPSDDVTEIEKLNDNE